MVSETEQLPHIFIEDDHHYDEIVTPFTERIADAFKTHYVVFWVIAGFILTLIHVVIMGRYEEIRIDTMWPSISFGMLPSATIISNIYFSKILERFTPSLFNILSWEKNKSIDWYTKQLNKIFSDKNIVISGLAMCLLLTPTAFYGPLLPEHYIARISFMVLMSIVTFTAGGTLYSLVAIIIMLDDLAKTNALKVSIYQHHLTSIKAIGSLMAKISITALLLYFLGISYNIACKQTIITAVTTAIFGVIILLLFILPQMKVHNIMSRVKQKRLIMFSVHLEKSLHDVTINPSEGNISQVRELFAIQNSLNEMNEWPFDTKMLITVLTGIAVPILLVLLQVICKP